MSQGKNDYTDPSTGGPTCKTNEIIYDAIYASLPDDCKLTFAQMFSNFDDLCPFKAPLYVNGKKIDFEKHNLNLLTDAECAEWWRLTVIIYREKYVYFCLTRYCFSFSELKASNEEVIQLFSMCLIV